jgi:hypothetical protein
MSLSRIINTPKRKLRALKRELDVYRPGMFSESQLTELKNLSNKEYKKKLLIYLNAQYFKPNEIKELTEKMFPWWEPYLNAIYLLTALIFSFLMYRSVAFCLAERVYLTELETTVTFTDSSVANYNLIDKNSLIILNKGSSNEELCETNFLRWLIYSSKKTSMNKVSWTKDKNLSNRLIYFYSDFFTTGTTNPSGDWCISYLKNKSNYFSALNLYNEIYKLKPTDSLKIDLTLPSSPNYKNCKPFIHVDDTNSKSFFLSVKDSNSSFSNIKLDFDNSGFIGSAKEILFYPKRQTETESKLIWEDVEKAGVGNSFLFTQNSELSKYSIPLGSNEAYPK